MILVIYIALLIISFYKKKSKKIFLTNLLFMWSVATFCYGIADEEVYLSRYTKPNMWIGATEFGFNGLINICHKFNLDFIGFKGVIYAICLFCIGTTIYKIAEYPNIVLMLYFICPFPLNVAQMRNYIATSIIIYFFRYIILESNSKVIIWKLDLNDLKYIVGIIIATTMHTSALLWLIFLLAKKLNTKNNYWVMLWTNILLMFIVTPNSLKKIAALFGAGNRINAYFSLEYAQSEWKHMGPISSVLVAALFAICIARYILKRSNNKELILCERINVLSLGFIGMMIRYTSEIRRIQEGICIINYIMITNAINKNAFKLNRISKKNLLIFCCLLIFLVIYTMMILIIYLNESVWSPFWFNNSLWNFSI